MGDVRRIVDFHITAIDNGFLVSWEDGWEVGDRRYHRIFSASFPEVLEATKAAFGFGEAEPR